MKHILHYVLALAAGGFITSAAEYFLNYNLIDLIKDKVLALFGKAKADVVAVESKAKAGISAEVKKL